ncbi:MAG TPA: peptidylprolyl isomerase [Steroidobacteraceae bacterium]|nr:peptidylprolyl isomerase [Steroidobacteraceae bacterium]
MNHPRDPGRRARRTRLIPVPPAAVLAGALAALIGAAAPPAAASTPAGAGSAPAFPAGAPRTMAEIIARSRPSDWRALDPQQTLYLDLPAGRVVIELAPQFAPQAVANVQLLAREHYYDGLWIERVQDDYVVQWGDPDGRKSLGSARRTLPAEFVAPSRNIPINALPDPDTYAPLVGFSDGFATGRDVTTGRTWLLHCYGSVGVGRDNDVDSGNGSELYAVIGQAPRQLDRNVTLIGRVVQGMELLSSLPRGTGPLGFYDKPGQRIPIRSVRVAADVPPLQRTALEVMRTDTQTFNELVESRRNRREEWYKVPAGHIDVCNIPIPVRPGKQAR